MAVAVKDRKENKVAFLRKYKNVIFNTNLLFANLPKKYRKKYEEVIIDELLTGQRNLIYGNEININEKNFQYLTKDDFKERSRSLKNGISASKHTTILFEELVNSLYRNKEFSKDNYEPILTAITVELGEVIDMLYKVEKYGNDKYKKFKKYIRIVEDLEDCGEENPEYLAYKMISDKVKELKKANNS